MRFTLLLERFVPLWWLKFNKNGRKKQIGGMKDKDSVPPKLCLRVFFPKLSKTRFGTVFHLSVICLFYRREIDLAVGFLHHLHCNLFPLLKNPNLTRFLWEAFFTAWVTQTNYISCLKNQMRGRICSTHFPKMSMTSILMINNKTEIFRICFDFVVTSSVCMPFLLRSFCVVHK